MRILNRPTVPRQAFPDLSRRTLNMQGDMARMIEHVRHRRRQRSKLQQVAWLQAWRPRPVLRARVKVARSEDDRGEMLDIPQRPAPRQPHLDGGATPNVASEEAGRQRGRV